MIGMAVKELDFVAFLVNLAPIALLNLILVLFVMDVLYRKSLKTQPELQAKIMAMDERKSLTNMSLLYRCLFVLVLVILGFFTHSITHIESSLIALTGGFFYTASCRRQFKGTAEGRVANHLLFHRSFHRCRRSY